MANNITIEICAEDRARLDKLNSLLEKITSTAYYEIPDPQETTTAPQEAPKGTREAAKPETLTTTPQTEEKPTDAAETKEEAQAKPSVTLEQIQQKVVQLAAGFGGSKKAQVRAIINAYGAKVSDLKEKPEKWDEVWEKLTALESEG